MRNENSGIVSACCFVIILLGVLAMSCASSPVVSAGNAEERYFAQAIRAIKINSTLVKKHFEPREAIVSGSGYAAVKDIVIKGTYQIDGSEISVSYYFSTALKDEKNRFTIPFFAEDPANGDSYIDVLFWTPSNEDAGLLLSFDDTFWDVWRRYFDLFDAYGAKVTFFVQGSLDSGVPSAEAADLKNFCAETLSRGHALGFHSVNHLNLPKVSRETFFSETIEAADVFSNEDIHFSAFAFPFGFSEPWMRVALSPFFPVTRGYGTNIRFYDTESGNDGYIISKAIDNIIYPDDTKFENDIGLILLAAKFTGHSIVPFTTHEISDAAQWGIKPKRLEYLLQTAKDLKLKFYTYSGLRERFSGNSEQLTKRKEQ